MARLKIPEEYRRGISKIKSLDDDSVHQIRQALDNVLGQVVTEKILGTSASEEATVKALKFASHEGSSAELKEIARAIVALYGVRSVRDVPLNDFVESVTEAMESITDESLRVSQADKSAFEDRLKVLLGSEGLSLTTKAYDLASEDERTFCSARFITDLRPVFGSAIEDGPKAMVITHLLKLAYHQGTEKHQHFYISLDSDDLRTLKALIERAEAKAESLRSSMKGLPILGASDEAR